MKQSYLQTASHALLMIGIITATVSCGESITTQKLDPLTDLANIEKQDEGVFRVNLLPTNPSIVSNVDATATVTVEGNAFSVNVTATGTPPSTIHPQHIHVGTNCPTQEDDTNGDGVIDLSEAEVRTGTVMVPLDGSLDASEGNDYPSASADGSYSYRQMTDLDALIQELGNQSTGSEGLNLEGRVVEIHGASADTNLPSTVQGGAERLPIACGVLERVGSEDTTGTTTGGTSTGGSTTGDVGTGTTTGEQTQDTTTGGKGG